MNDLDLIDIKEKQGIPRNALFCGFVIYFPENDEYLHYFEDNEMIERCGYSRIPNLAIVYQDQHQAFSQAKKIQYRSLVSLLFEDENRYYVAHQDDV